MAGDKKITLRRLRNMIPNDAPTVTVANWGQLNEAGWRFECNLDINNENAVVSLRNLQIKCGKDNVATGHSFPADKTIPTPSADLLGVYIRDIDDLASTLAAGLGDDDKLAAWLSN